MNKNTKTKNIACNIESLNWLSDNKEDKSFPVFLDEIIAFYKENKTIFDKEHKFTYQEKINFFEQNIKIDTSLTINERLHYFYCKRAKMLLNKEVKVLSVSTISSLANCNAVNGNKFFNETYKDYYPQDLESIKKIDFDNFLPIDS